MKRSLVTAAVLSALFVSAGAFADDYESGKLIINGEVVGSTCKFIDNNEAIIQMNPVSSASIIATQEWQSYEGYENQTVMPLKINCANLPEGHVPYLTVSKTQFLDGKDITINTADAEGVGFSVTVNSADIKPSVSDRIPLGKVRISRSFLPKLTR
ncbi:fimbrial protein YehD [Pseudenterobacter timonensis]|uniref:fimbrial protein YehD n=1 Tax=Pseudenterobacter timonensis TaxID=1755099 RepID=UPI00077B8123|nr:fimbrial protein YehD [Pseudenterobacter timonensis]